MREQNFPDETQAWFPHHVRDTEGRLSVVRGETLERHLARLAWVRELLLGTFGDMTAGELRRVRHLERKKVTPEWVLAHLTLHEAQHTGQILQLLTLHRR